MPAPQKGGIIPRPREPVAGKAGRQDNRLHIDAYNQRFLINENAMRRLLVTSLLAFFSIAAPLAQAEVIDIDNVELARLSQSGVPVIDIRLQSEWEETGIVAGSTLLTFFDERGKADPAAWLEKVKPLAGPNQPVVVICRSGNRTKAVSQFLSQQAGYATVYNVKQGIKGWIAAGAPVVAAKPVIVSCKAAKTC